VVTRYRLAPGTVLLHLFAALFLVDFSSIVSRLVLSGNGFLRRSGCFDGEHSTAGFPLVLNLLPPFPLPDTSFFRLVLCCVGCTELCIKQLMERGLARLEKVHECPGNMYTLSPQVD
jgi:hypothetical protein